MRALACSLAAVVPTVLLTGVLAAQQPAPSQRPASTGSSSVTVAQIEKPSTDSWPTYNGDYTGRRFSSLAKINAANVRHLSLAWIYDLPAAGIIYDPSDNPMGWGGTDRGGYAEQPQLKAIDYATGKIRWSVPRYGGNSGILTTAGNVLFNAAAAGIGAYNATTGEALWNARLGNSVTNGPITYELDGLQYVIAGAGSRLVAFVLNQ
jgi:glucose dehydrogenase